MEPETSAPKFGPEQLPTEHGTTERVAQPSQPETGLETGADRREQIAEMSAIAADNSGSSATVALPTPVLVTDDQSQSSDISSTTSPTIASDDDLIEKEWVDRAKKIVADNRNDPYHQEKAVTELQKDYLKKRYGRQLGGAE